MKMRQRRHRLNVKRKINIICRQAWSDFFKRTEQKPWSLPHLPAGQFDDFNRAFQALHAAQDFAVDKSAIMQKEQAK